MRGLSGRREGRLPEETSCITYLRLGLVGDGSCWALPRSPAAGGESKDLVLALYRLTEADLGEEGWKAGGR